MAKLNKLNGSSKLEHTRFLIKKFLVKAPLANVIYIMFYFDILLVSNRQNNGDVVQVPALKYLS